MIVSSLWIEFERYLIECHRAEEAGGDGGVVAAEGEAAGGGVVRLGPHVVAHQGRNFDYQFVVARVEEAGDIIYRFAPPAEVGGLAVYPDLGDVADLAQVQPLGQSFGVLG